MICRGMPWCVYGGQRTTLWSQFSSSIFTGFWESNSGCQICSVNAFPTESCSEPPLPLCNGRSTVSGTDLKGDFHHRHFRN